MSVVQVDSLSRRFASTHAVRDVSFTVERGQIFGLLGPNGSGKTTTLACTLGLLAPTSGRTHVLGEPSRRIHATQGRVGTVFDGASLLPGLTVRANLEYARRLLGPAGRQPDGRGIDDALEAVGLTGLARRRAGKLSLGQAKRVAVARALLGKPEVLVLDEPLSALDTLGVSSMLALLRELAADGVTLLVSSHRLPEMESIVTHAGVLSGGRLVANGSLEELLGGRRETHEITASARTEALAACAELSGVSARPGATNDSLEVELDGVPIGEVNRTLVERGCTVSRIVPRRRDLSALFDELVQSAADGPPTDAEEGR